MSTIDRSVHQGFDRARDILQAFESAERLHAVLDEATFREDPRVRSVHVDADLRSGQVILVAYDLDGADLGVDLVPAPEGRPLDAVAKVEPATTGLRIPRGSALAQRVALRTGWVVDLDAARALDLAELRHASTRRMLLSLLADLAARDEVTGFVFGEDLTAFPDPDDR